MPRPTTPSPHASFPATAQRTRTVPNRRTVASARLPRWTWIPIKTKKRGTKRVDGRVEQFRERGLILSRTDASLTGCQLMREAPGAG
jgi:hypothetical protein